MVKERLLNPRLQWSKPRPTKDASVAVRGAYALRTDGSAYSPVPAGRRVVNSMKETNGHLHAAFHTVLTELGILSGRRLLGERSHRQSLSWGKPSKWRRVTGLEAAEREGMRDAES
jgi:hypothetical protein